MALINPPALPAQAAEVEARLGLDDAAAPTYPRGGQANPPGGAAGFAMGSPIFFTNGAYDPGATAEGRRLLSHELTHVVQQGR